MEVPSHDISVAVRRGRTDCALGILEPRFAQAYDESSARYFSLREDPLGSGDEEGKATRAPPDPAPGSKRCREEAELQSEGVFQDRSVRRRNVVLAVRLNSELQQTGGDCAPSLLGGGKRKKGRPGPRRPRRREGAAGEMARMNRGMINIGDAPQARFQMIGPNRTLPGFKFKERMMSVRYQASAGAFLTKTNLTGNQIKGAAAGYGFALAWALVDLGVTTSYAGIFDQFRFSKIICRFSTSRNTNATGFASLLYVVVDYDNSTLIGSVGAAQQYQSCQTVHGSDVGNGESLVVELTPAIAIPAVSGHMIQMGAWEDIASPSNAHFGIKGWYATAALTDPVWDVDAQYWIDFRNTQ